MNELQLLQNDPVSRVIFAIAGEYDDKDKLTHDELNQLCLDAEKHFESMNGDAGQVALTVRQFALLLAGAMTGESCQKAASAT